MLINLRGAQNFFSPSLRTCDIEGKLPKLLVKSEMDPFGGCLHNLSLSVHVSQVFMFHKKYTTSA